MMILFLPIDFSSLRFELYMLLAALLLVLLSWVCLFIKSLHSHLNTPIIRNNSNMIGKNKPSFKPPFVSVIVPARNEGDNIEKCLLSILTQKYPNFEVVAVDDNSDDKTLEIMKGLKSRQAFSKKLKVVSLSAKPDGWMGKTWASQQGYMNSSGDILLFTDADSIFESRYAIELSIRQMLSEKLDALTGVPYLPLLDFWSKVVMPVWNLYSEVFDRGIADANDPKSRVAFVMGSFFMIKRHVFEAIGDYKSVKDEIQEDRAIGNLIKRSQYRIKMFKVDRLVTALWSRDVSSLWHGIRRSVMPAAIEDKSAIISHQLILFAMIALPFFLLPYNAATLYSRSSYSLPPSTITTVPNIGQILPDAQSAAHQQQQQQLQNSILKLPAVALNPPNKEEPYLETALFWFNLSLCLLIIVTTGIKSVMKYRLVPLYSVLCIIGGLFLIASYAYSILPLLIGFKMQPIEWRGRPHHLTLHYNEKKKTI
jgi:chlorobactene glucosyltransferase